MQQSKHIQLLRTLSKEELRRFRKLLQSPFFTTNVNLLAFHDLIKKYYPAFDAPKLTKEQVFKQLFPRKVYDDNKMRGLLKEYTRLIEEFLIWQEAKEQQDRPKQLLKVYAKRNLFDWYKRGRVRYIKTLEAKPFRDLAYYEEIIDLEATYFYHPTRQKFDKSDNTLAQLMEAIDKRFILSKLRYGVEVQNQKRIFQKEYDLHFWDLVEAEIAKPNKNKVIELFSLLMKLFAEEADSLDKLEHAFFTQIKALRLIDAQLVHGYTINYLNRKVNLGQSQYSAKALSWYKFGLDNQLLLQNDKISEAAFGNILICACREKEFAWAKTFMANYGDKINSTHREQVVQFNLGLWHYYQGALNEAFAVLYNYDFHDSFQLKVRFNTMRILFEQYLADESYYDTLLLNTKAFQKYLNRTTTFSPIIIAANKNTIELIKALMVKIDYRERKRDIKIWFADKIITQKNIVGRQWLAEKVNGL